ncbi:hypothetical protein AGMMS49965_14600 [Bacteroidia bacterium]|nr:hypothetical protein AGMMS49965_14600 [Bacteroidia bacterium]
MDKVIALGLDPSKEQEEKFDSIFHPNFPINNFPREKLLELTDRYPVAYYIKSDTVQFELRGELPCSYLFQQMIEN